MKDLDLKKIKMLHRRGMKTFFESFSDREFSEGLDSINLLMDDLKTAIEVLGRLNTHLLQLIDNLFSEKHYIDELADSDDLDYKIFLIIQLGMVLGETLDIISYMEEREKVLRKNKKIFEDVLRVFGSLESLKSEREELWKSLEELLEYYQKVQKTL